VTDLAFDPVIHAPARLQIMAVLAGVQDAEFIRLRDTVQVSDSVLSKHLAQLSDAGYVRLRKAAQGGRQRTWAELTRDGRRAFAAHVETLQALAKVAERAAAE
jgi:DNA-binding MarR family transcriptional regulator